MSTEPHLPQAVDEVKVEDGLRWWQCSACGFRMGYHPDDIQLTAASTTYCDLTGGYEPLVPVEEPVVWSVPHLRESRRDSPHTLRIGKFSVTVWPRSLPWLVCWGRRQWWLFDRGQNLG